MNTIIIAQKASPGKLFPALIASSIINAAGNAQPVSVVYREADLLSKADESSTIGIQSEGESQIYGPEAVLKKLVETYPAVLRGQAEPSLEDEWVSFSFSRLSGVDFKATTAALGVLDSHLTLRTFLVGYSLTVADIAVWGTLNGNGQAISAIKRNHLPNLVRWFKYIGSMERVASCIDAFRTEIATKKKAKSKETNYEIGLLGTEKGVVTRFPPEPSGYLHIGHAKAAMLNQYFAQHYGGSMIVRFDDTNPTKEKQEYQDAILQDLELLGIKGDKLTYTSDYFDQLYQEAVKLIKLGKAYCDDTVQEQMRAERMDGIASKNRDRSIEENLRIFEEMSNATEVGVRNCLRAKISVDDPNKALRDPVLYRCNPTPHHRTGTKFKVYPTYDFACPLVDSIEGVTHALRTIEYRDRTPQHAWMIKALGMREVHVWDFSRLSFIKTPLSKRKLKWFVEEGLVWGWDDPRFPTVRGIRRRGMTIEALRQFILQQGPSKNVVNLDWTIIWAGNKKVIDPVAPRHTAIIDSSHVKSTIAGVPTATSDLKPKHKKNPSVGLKKLYYGPTIILDQADARGFSVGEEITLMDWGNAIVASINRPDPAGDVLSLELTLHLEGDFKKTEKKVTWLSVDQSLVPVQLATFDYLITKDKLEEDDDLKDFVNRESIFTEDALADENIAEVKVDDIIQFERKGYYRCDKAAGKDGERAVFFLIPTGKGEKPTEKK